MVGARNAQAQETSCQGKHSQHWYESGGAGIFKLSLELHGVSPVLEMPLPEILARQQNPNVTFVSR